jgi:hypothetical protein
MSEVMRISELDRRELIVLANGRLLRSGTRFTRAEAIAELERRGYVRVAEARYLLRDMGLQDDWV